MKSSNVHRFLVGTLALVLVAGIGTPAFAQEGSTIQIPNNVQNFVPMGHDPPIFENGQPDFQSQSGFLFNEPWTPAEDFFFDQDTLVTDYHFILLGSNNFLPPIEFTIYADAPGLPGNVLASGTAQNLELNQLDTNISEVWFDLDVPFEADAGVVYWFGIHSPNSGNSGCLFGQNGLGNNLHSFNSVDQIWFEQVSPCWFILSGHPIEPVGGELLPIDNTALLLAGMQSMTVWMIPTVLGLAGAGVYLVKFRKN